MLGNQDVATSEVPGPASSGDTRLRSPHLHVTEANSFGRKAESVTDDENALGICWFASLATLASGINGRDLEANYSEVLDIFFSDRGERFYQLYNSLPDDERMPGYEHAPPLVDFETGGFGGGTVWFSPPYIKSTIRVINTMIQPLGIQLDSAYANEVLAEDILEYGFIQRMLQILGTNDLTWKILERRMTDRLMTLIQRLTSNRRGIIYPYFGVDRLYPYDSHAVAIDGVIKSRRGRALVIHNMNLDKELEVSDTDPDYFLGVMGIPRKNRNLRFILRNYKAPLLVVGALKLPGDSKTD